MLSHLHLHAASLLPAWQVGFGVRTWIPTTFRYLSNQTPERPSGGWQVSSFGRVCNTNGVVTRGYLHPSGYRGISLCGQFWRVHRVIMIAFHGLPCNVNAWQVNHRDGDRSNNRLDNLEYASQSQNISHSYANLQRRDPSHSRSKPVQWRAQGANEWKTSTSVLSASQEVGLHPQTVSKHCHNRSSVKGIEFRFVDHIDTAFSGEEWKPMLDPVSASAVPGRMVSSFGRITSSRNVISKGCFTNQGYYQTEIRLNSVRQGVLVHRLVAAAFLGPPPSIHHRIVNHKDLDKGNNCLGNLEWTTPSENRLHFLASSCQQRRSDRKPVWSRRKGDTGHWTWHPSILSAASTLRVHGGNISLCVRGVVGSAGGFEFCAAKRQEEEHLPGEEWRDIDVVALQRDRAARRG